MHSLHVVCLHYVMCDCIACISPPASVVVTLDHPLPWTLVPSRNYQPHDQCETPRVICWEVHNVLAYERTLKPTLRSLPCTHVKPSSRISHL